MPFFWHILAIITITLPHALGYNLVLGKGKILHFGPLGSSLLAAYATFATLQATGSYPLALGAGILGALSIGAFFAWLSFRLDGDGLGILSLASHLALLTVVLNWTSVTNGTRGITAIPWLPFLHTPMSFAIVTTVVALTWIAFYWHLDRSVFGRQLSALAEHPWHARSLGVYRKRVHLIAFLLASLGALSTNFFYHQYIHLTHPTDFGFPVLIFYLMCVVAGRPGSVLGVTFSTIALVLLQESIRFLPIPAGILGPTRLLLFGTILLIAVWFRRDVLFPPQRSI